MSWSTAGQVENEESVHQFNLLSQEQHTGMGMSMDWKASVLTPTAKKIKKKTFDHLNILFSGLHVRKNCSKTTFAIMRSSGAFSDFSIKNLAEILLVEIFSGSFPVPPSISVLKRTNCQLRTG